MKKKNVEKLSNSVDNCVSDIDYKIKRMPLKVSKIIEFLYNRFAVNNKKNQYFKTALLNNNNTYFIIKIKSYILFKRTLKLKKYSIIKGLIKKKTQTQNKRSA